MKNFCKVMQVKCLTFLDFWKKLCYQNTNYNLSLLRKQKYRINLRCVRCLYSTCTKTYATVKNKPCLKKVTYNIDHVIIEIINKSRMFASSSRIQTKKNMTQPHSCFNSKMSVKTVWMTINEIVSHICNKNTCNFNLVSSNGKRQVWRTINKNMMSSTNCLPSDMKMNEVLNMDLFVSSNLLENEILSHAKQNISSMVLSKQ